MMMKKMPEKRGPKKVRRYVRRREAMEAASRFRLAEDGTRYVVRFTTEQRIQHWILLLSFTTLGITGLAQTFYNTPLGNFILLACGGIDSARQIHHVAAFIFGVEALYHFAISIYEMFVYRRISRIWPDWSDFTGLIDMLKLNLGLSRAHPRFDRFNFEEKAEYWALIWGTIVMGATGLIQGFPLQVTSVLPGWIIPVAHAFHRWEAILAVLAILTWHLYHTLIKTRNFSIFNGLMSMAQMEEEHPLELAYLEQAALALKSSTWPALIEIPLGEEAEEAAAVAPEETGRRAEEGSVAGAADLPAPAPSTENAGPAAQEVSSLAETAESPLPANDEADASAGEESPSPLTDEGPATETVPEGEA